MSDGIVKQIEKAFFEIAGRAGEFAALAFESALKRILSQRLKLALGKKEAAAALSISERQLDRLVESKKIGYFKHDAAKKNSKITFDVRQLLDYQRSIEIQADNRDRTKFDDFYGYRAPVGDDVVTERGLRLVGGSDTEKKAKRSA